MRTIETKVYKFDELSETAKQAARDEFRKNGFGFDWWDSTYEDAEQVAEVLGIDIKQRAIPTHGGRTIDEPAIYFSGFCSQGDGACFEGSYRYKTGSS